MRALAVCVLLLTCILAPTVQAQQPDLTQEHWYHTYATLTVDVNAWADDYPDIVDLTVAGQTELGRNLWVVRISDWSNDTKPDGSLKDIVYIDGGHHGNEHLGTELAFLTAEHYIEGWAAKDPEVVRVLTTTEIHVLVMLNADGNDINTRWNINQVDLNRNYDHHWNEHDETQPGSGPFSEAETLANSIYMNTVVPRADLYVTMHTGVWIMLYPWGIVPEQPIDWELFHGIREEVHANISSIPIQNANQGLYPNSGTSRDYGYGIMGFPTFTFETDDEQWLPGSLEPLTSRLGEELDVMEYLISNVWYWRARLTVDALALTGDMLTAKVTNHGMATTANASLEYLDETGEVQWASPLFTVNATNATSVSFSFDQTILSSNGVWNLNYQKRIINSAMWVNETQLDVALDSESTNDDRFLTGFGVFNPFSVVVSFIGVSVVLDRRNRDALHVNDAEEPQQA